MILGIFDGLGFKSALLMALCVCVCGSVDGSVCVCVWLCWLCPMGFFFFFPSVVTLGFFFFFNMGFCFAGILVSSGQWWLGFFWVFVLMGLCVSHRC